MQYTKKPLTIDAIEWKGEELGREELMTFMGVDNLAMMERQDGIFDVMIDTLEGAMTATKGDFIIKGVKGEFYPCKPDVFKASYTDVNGIDEKPTAKVLDFAESLGLKPDDISDGYHTFQDLYDHRKALFAALTKSAGGWRSKLHSDGTMHEGYFIVGINSKPGEQITYHYEMKDWDKFEHCMDISNAPEFDGHTPEDVVERLLNYKIQPRFFVTVIEGHTEYYLIQYRMSDFRKACEPLVEYLNKNHHPHTTVIVTCSGAELLEGLKSEKIEEFLRD